MWDRRYSDLKGVYKFKCRSDTMGAGGKGKHKFCTYVNSKLKNREKIKIYMKFRGTEDTQVHKMCAHFFMFGHRRSSWRKKTKI